MGGQKWGNEWGAFGMNGIQFRKLHADEFDKAYSIICEAVDWLLSKNIRQWTVPLPRHVYEEHQRKEQNFTLMCNGKLAVVLSLVREANPHWKEHLSPEEYWWLSTMTTAPSFRGKEMGRRAIQEAMIILQDKGVEELYLDCVHGDGFLPKYYESLGFVRVARKDVQYPTGIFDMVLMKKNVLVSNSQ